jgi:hypothetical protein
MVIQVGLSAELKQLALRQAPSPAVDRVQAQVSGLETSVSGAEQHQEVGSVT